MARILFNTVFAAYLHCRNGNGGQFHTSSALFGNATIFALGGSRIELSGDHMLFTEYFPDNDSKNVGETAGSLSFTIMTSLLPMKTTCEMAMLKPLLI